MKEMVVDWSNLPEGLLDLIAVRLFSVIEHRRFRSICTSWRSSGNINPFTSRPLIHFDPIPRSITQLHDDVYLSNPSVFLSRAAFFRVTLSSSPSKGWLIKSDVDINSGRFRLLDPLSRHLLRCPSESLDLLEFTVSEIREAYAVLKKVNVRIAAPGFQRSALVKVKEGEDHRYGVLGIGWDGDINYWNGRVFRKLKQIGHKFSNIIVHKGQTYVLDSKGSIWWIDSSLSIVRYGPSLGENITNSCCGDRSLVECCGEFYIVDRLLEENPRKRKADSSYTNVSVWNAKTVGFKVYKFDDEKLGTMVEVKSLGDSAFLIATDTCFSVLANEFYGCLKNSIYFTEENEIKVFQLDNGMITSMSKFSQSCFQMFVPSFL